MNCVGNHVHEHHKGECAVERQCFEMKGKVTSLVPTELMTQLIFVLSLDSR